MPTSPRVRGKSGLIFSLKNGAAAAQNFGDDIKKVSPSTDDADDSNVTFYEVQQGLTKVYALVVTLVVSYDPASLYMYLWNNPGATLALAYGPQGNATPTTAKPHIVGTVLCTGKPLYELEANLDANYGADVEYTFNVQGDLTHLTA
jgi:hypothetical protein